MGVVQIAEMVYGLEQKLRRIMIVPTMAAGVALILLMLLTITDVFLRFLFSKPIVGAPEISVSLIVCAGFLGIAGIALEQRHIKVDLLVRHFPPRVQAVLDCMNYLMVMVLSALIALESYHQALLVHKLFMVSELLHIPQYPFYLAISLSFLLLLLAVAAMLLHAISKVVLGK